MATITIADNRITVKLSRRNIEQLTDPYTPPEYSLWKKVTVNGRQVPAVCGTSTETGSENGNTRRHNVCS